MKESFSKFLDIVTSRWAIKAFFFVIFLGSAIKLLMFERWARGLGPYVSRPEAVAGLLPVGHFTSFFAWLKGGGWDMYLPAGLIIIIAAITLSFIFKRGFCGFVCPVGTVWEASSSLGRKVLGKNYALPKWIDWTGRGLQIVLSVLAFAFLALVSLPEALQFRILPYMWVADIKILHSFANPGFILAILLALIVSFFFTPLWCRYLCPVGGLYSIFGLASVFKVKRDPQTCIDCKKCDQVCHALVKPSNKIVVHSTTCDGCMDCVRVCPVDKCLEAKGPGGISISPRVWIFGVLLVWFGIVFFAMAAGLWKSPIADELFKQIINSGLLEETTKGFF